MGLVEGDKANGSISEPRSVFHSIKVLDNLKAIPESGGASETELPVFVRWQQTIPPIQVIQPIEV